MGTKEKPKSKAFFAPSTPSQNRLARYKKKIRYKFVRSGQHSKRGETVHQSNKPKNENEQKYSQKTRSRNPAITKISELALRIAHTAEANPSVVENDVAGGVRARKLEAALSHGNLNLVDAGLGVVGKERHVVVGGGGGKSGEGGGGEEPGGEDGATAGAMEGAGGGADVEVGGADGGEEWGEEGEGADGGRGLLREGGNGGGGRGRMKEALKRQPNLGFFQSVSPGDLV